MRASDESHHWGLQNIMYEVARKVVCKYYKAVWGNRKTGRTLSSSKTLVPAGNTGGETTHMYSKRDHLVDASGHVALAETAVGLDRRNPTPELPIPKLTAQSNHSKNLVSSSGGRSVSLAIC